MEKQFFTFESWDMIDDATYQYNDCTLTNDVGRFKSGDKVDNIYISFADGVMEFYKGDSVVATFNLKLVATERV